MLVATPRDYFASCHDMKRDEKTRVQGDLLRSNLETFPILGLRSEVRNGAPVTALGRFADVGDSETLSSHASYSHTSESFPSTSRLS